MSIRGKLSRKFRRSRPRPVEWLDEFLAVMVLYVAAELIAEAIRREALARHLDRVIAGEK